MTRGRLVAIVCILVLSGGALAWLRIGPKLSATSNTAEHAGASGQNEADENDNGPDRRGGSSKITAAEEVFHDGDKTRYRGVPFAKRKEVEQPGRGSDRSGVGRASGDPSVTIAHFESSLNDAFHNQAAPLVEDCYKKMLTRVDGGGNVTVSLTVVGTKGTGGVVEDAQLSGLDAGTFDNAFSECVRQSLMAIQLEPPPAGASSVTISRPLSLSPSP